MAQPAKAALARLERGLQARGREAACEKLALLGVLERSRLADAASVRRLHDALCFLLAYPDDRPVLRTVARMLEGFDARSDLRRFARELCGSGIAGTPVRYPFYYHTACWLAARWPERLRIDWERYRDRQGLDDLLSLLLPYVESLTVDSSPHDCRELLARLKGPGETDAAFLVRRFQHLDAHPDVRQKLFEDLDIPMELAPDAKTPSRTRSRLPGCTAFYVTSAPPRDVDWRRMAPPAVRTLSARRGARVVELARVQMVTRGRDLYAFMHASSRGVRLFDMGDGLQFACIGLEPERRFMLETLYVYLALQGGVPVAYVQSTSFLGSAEINFNVFDTFRGAQARHVFRSVLAMVRHDTGCRTFIINTQQLGEGNREALETGAWWFYHKFGFRPRDPQVSRLMRAELRKKAANPAHRSSIRTLERLADSNLYLTLGRSRAHTVNDLAVENIGLAVSSALARRFGAEREAADAVCAEEAGRLLGLRREPVLGRAARTTWRRWAPLVLVLPGIERWPRRERRALAEIVVAKAADCEADYLARVTAHPRLERALITLSRRGD